MKPIHYIQAMVAAAGLSGWAALADGRETIQLAATPTLSPDGRVLVFSWDGDLWRAETQGGRATPLTHHPADDRWAAFSPDGRQLAYQSDSTGEPQLFVMPRFVTSENAAKM